MMPGGFQELLDEFLLEARERADQVESLLLGVKTGSPTEQRESLARAKRELHTLKGNSGMMGFTDLQQIAHTMEDRVEELDLDAPEIDSLLTSLDAMRRGLEAIRSTDDTTPEAATDKAEDQTEATLEQMAEGTTPDAGSSVRVSFSKIDHLVEMQAETLIFRNRLSDAIDQLLARLAQLSDLPAETLRELREAADDVDAARMALGKTLNLVQDQVTEMGMVPLQSLFRSLGRIVHDESRRESKSVDLRVRGGETPIDKTLLEAAGDALGHLVRNAVIHGIETPEVRHRRGKPARGTIEVSADIEAGEVRIEIRDDGGGIDLERLRERAREVVGVEADGIPDVALLFEAGVSTRDATDIGAGRGVGLSAVKKSVDSHGGRVRVHSEPGAGSIFSLHLPVSAAIQRSLLISVDGEEYALALSSITETVALDPATIHEMHHAEVLRWRGTLVPLLDLGRLFGTAAARRDEGFVTIIEANGRHRGLALDRLVGIHDIVVKGLDGIVGQPAGISGSTILGDGRVIMILDPASLVGISPSSLASSGLATSALASSDKAGTSSV
ncbi:MAG: chemotaxis protein CheW [Acidobacteriota bacterium]